jgi:ribosome-binding protein aMBF1 (putative translation factor)
LKIDDYLTKLRRRIDQTIRRTGMSKAQFARNAKLHVNSVAKMDSKDWLPSVRTIKKVESALAKSSQARSA